MMKKLLLLAFMAVASEAMAQEAQCVAERAAMVEIIRAYARSGASPLGPQGLSERVLEAMGPQRSSSTIRSWKSARVQVTRPQYWQVPTESQAGARISCGRHRSR